MTPLYVCGDSHGNWNDLNRITSQIMEKHQEERVDLIICGDFGYWPGYVASFSDINTYEGRLQIYFVPGNHENWDKLDELERTSSERIIPISKNIFYCAFGVTKEFNDKIYLFCGGADSIDKHYRVEGLSWFPQEIITEKDMGHLPDEPVHTVISHTCPNLVFPILQKYLGYSVRNTDPSSKRLSFIYNKYLPKKWFFAHWHTYCQFRYANTDFACLDKLDSDKPYVLPIL